MKLKIIVTLLLCGGLGASAWAQCGGGIPSAGNPGCVPPDRSNSPYHNGGGGGSAPPPEAWANRFGAIASNHKGPYAVAANENSQAKAEQIALSKCGKSDCEIMISYRNQCVAYAWGVGRGGFDSAPEIRRAEASAMALCTSTGVSCEIIYSACSMPVRIQ